jgi:hypothetical protein
MDHFRKYLARHKYKTQQLRKKHVYTKKFIKRNPLNPLLISASKSTSTVQDFRSQAKHLRLPTMFRHFLLMVLLDAFCDILSHTRLYLVQHSISLYMKP